MEKITAKEYREKYLDKEKGDGRKYNSVTSYWGGKWHGEDVNLKFRSKKEMNRFLELRLLEKKDIITDLSLQPAFIVKEKSERSGQIRYTADFKYKSAHKYIIEDVKSLATAKKDGYILRKKLFLEKFGERYIFKETL